MLPDQRCGVIKVENDWHLNKTVTIGNMLTAILAILALIGSYYTLDRRIALLEEAKVEHEEALLAMNDRICKRLDKIENLILQVHFNKESSK